MADSYLEDYSKYRANPWATTWSGNTPAVEDRIGREDPTYVTAVDTTLSGLKTNYR